jgi:Kef-type K+ transport system membrane component KefB
MSILGEESLILPFLLPLVAASLMGLLVRKAGLSVVAGYIAGGIIVGPILRLVDPFSDILSFLSELGIILISFEIGLAVKTDFFSRGGSKAAGIVGVEVVIISLTSYLIGFLLSLRWGDMLVLIFMAVNTSTVVTFKMLEERRFSEMEARRLVLGVGAFEDVVAMVALTIFPILSLVGIPSPVDLLRVTGGIVVSIVLMVYLGLRVLTRPLGWIAKKEAEIFLAISLAVVLIYSYVGVISGLSAALGAFVAGLVVSNSEVSGIVSERLRSLRELSALIFFSSIGASLHVTPDPALIAVALSVALLVVLVKFFGFSVSSWVLGLKLEDSFRLGLYMLAISEFGVIIARNAVESGAASQSFYLVSVLALSASALISSTLIKYEGSLPRRLSGMVPPAFSLYMERFSAVIRDALGKQSSALADVKEALWELVKRVAIIFLMASGANLAFAYVTPALPSTIRPHVESVIAVSAILFVLLVGIRMRKTFRRLSRGVVGRLGGPQRQIEDMVVGFLYTLTIGFISIAMIIISAPQIGRALTVVLSKEGSSVVALMMIVLILMLMYRYALRVVRRLEGSFQIE